MAPQVGVDGALLFGASMALKINKNEKKNEKVMVPQVVSRFCRTTLDGRVHSVFLIPSQKL